jgi:prepilin-type N-terminal cleavage/methylation domain-containing protein
VRTRTRQRGFTLIELITVFVTVSILSAIAIQKFMDLQDDTKRAAARGIAGALESSSTANYLLRSGATSVPTIPVSDCVHAASLMLPGAMSGFAIAPKPVSPGAAETCTVDHVRPGQSTAARFIVRGA